MKLFLALAVTIGTVHIAIGQEKKTWTEAECRDFAREIGKRWAASAKKDAPEKVAGVAGMEKLLADRPPGSKGGFTPKQVSAMEDAGLKHWYWSCAINTAIDSEECKAFVKAVWNRSPDVRNPAGYVELLIRVGVQQDELRELVCGAAKKLEAKKRLEDFEIKALVEVAGEQYYKNRP